MIEHKEAVENSTTRSIQKKVSAPAMSNLSNLTVHVNSQNHSKKVVVRNVGKAKVTANDTTKEKKVMKDKKAKDVSKV